MESRDQCEKSVLGAMLTSPEACEVAFAMLQKEDFGDLVHSMIFESMLTIFDGTELDLATVLRFVKSTRIESGESVNKTAAGILAKCLEACGPTWYHIRYYANLVLEFSARRKIEVASADLARVSGNADIRDVSGLLGQCQSILGELERFCIRDSESVRSLRELNAEVREELNRPETGEVDPGEPMTSGLHDLDQICQFFPGELVIIAARPSDGKTALACNIAEHMARRQKRVLIFSLEMSTREIHTRLACSVAGVDSKRFKLKHLNAVERQAVLDTLDDLDNCSIWIDDAGKPSVNEIIAKARLQRRKRGLDCVMVDYLTLVKPANERAPRDQQIGKISEDLKAAAKELNVPVICLAQLNRDNVKDKREPRLSDLRGSGNIEENADTAIFIHQETDLSTIKNVGTDDCFPASLIVAKQRNGQRGKVSVVFFPALCMFASRAAKHMENYQPSFDVYNSGDSNSGYEF